MGFGKDGKGAILYGGFDLVPGALAPRAVVAGGSGYLNALDEDFRVIKVEYFLTYKPAAAGDVMLVGMADGAISNVLIEEALESRPSDSNDYPAVERAMRPVWPLEIMGDHTGDVGPVTVKGEKTIRWTFSNPEGWQWWFYNMDAAAAWGGANEVHLTSKIYGVWVK